MRSFCLFLALFFVLVLSGCGSEDDTSPPSFRDIRINGSTDFSTTFSVSSVTITGTIDDFGAKIVANSSATGERGVDVNSADGNWIFVFEPLSAGSNIITLTATDDRGNINQMILTVLYVPLVE